MFTGIVEEIGEIVSVEREAVRRCCVSGARGFFREPARETVSQ